MFVTDMGEKKKVKHVVIGDVARAALATKGAGTEEPTDGASDDAISKASSGAELPAEVAAPKVTAAELFANFGDVAEY